MVKSNVVGEAPYARSNLDLFSIEGVVGDGVIVVYITVSRGVYVVVTSTVETGSTKLWEGRIVTDGIFSHL